MKVRVLALILAPYLATAHSSVAAAGGGDGASLTVHKILGLYIPPATGQETGPAVLTDDAASSLSVPEFSRIVIEPKGASRLEGVGTPGSKIVLNSSGRTIGAAIVESDGHWLVTLNEGLPPGEHRISSGVSTNGNGKILYGDEVRIAVPKELKGAAVVAYDALRAPLSAGPDTSARQRGEELGRAASEKFNDVAPPKSFPPATGKKFDGRLAQDVPAPAAKAPAESPNGVPEPDGVAGAVVDWLKRSAREYNGVIIKDLSVPAPGTTPPRDTETAGDRPVPAPSGLSIESKDRTGQDAAQDAAKDAAKDAAQDAAQDAAKDLVEQRRKAEDEYRLKQQAEAKRKAEDAARLGADKVRKAADAKKAAEEFARKKAAADAKIQESLRQLEAAKKEMDGKTAAEAKRIAEEAARKDAARKAGEAQAKKAADENRQAAKDAAKSKDKDVAAGTGDKPAPLGVKPQPETFGDAVAEEQQKSAGGERTAPQFEDDADLPEQAEEPQRQSKRTSITRKTSRKAEASRTKGWRGNRSGGKHATASCRYGTVYYRRHKRFYVVGPNDTLWSIARRFYGRGTRYNVLFQANRRRLSNPDTVWTCMRLRVPRKC